MVETCSWAPVLPGPGSEFGVGAGAAAGGLQRRGEVPAGLPGGEVVAIQMEGERGRVSSGVVRGELTPVDVLT